MEIVWEVLFLLQANFIVCISGMGRAGIAAGLCYVVWNVWGFIVCKTLKWPRGGGRGGNRDPFGTVGLLPSVLKTF